MAGAGRRTFTPGEVLTASNVMNYLQDQAVMNFAGTAARGSAIGTAVSEGMVSYLADTNVVQAYDGSAWNSLAYASSVSAIPRVGLVPIVPTSVSINAGSSSYDSTTGEVTFTGGSVLNVNGVFSSSYRHYRVMWEIESSTAGADIYMQFKNAGGTLATAYYNYSAASNTSAAFGGSYQANQTFANVGRTNGTQGSFLVIDLINPGNTKIKRWTAQTVDQLLMRTSNGYNFTATAYTDLVIYPNGQNATSGTVKIYGYN